MISLVFCLFCQLSFEDNNFRLEGRAKSSIVQENVTHGTSALKVDFTQSEDAVDIYFKPSMELVGDKLLIDVYSPYTIYKYFLIKFYTNSSTYLVNNVTVWPGKNTVEVDLRKMTDRKFLLIKLYTEEPLVLWFDNFRMGEPKYIPVPKKELPLLTDATNLVPNGDFEMGLKGWKAWSWDGDYRQSSDEGVSGIYSCGLKCIKEGAAGIFSDYFKVPKGTYEFSFWVKGPGRYRWSLSSPTPTLKNHYIDKVDLKEGWQNVKQQVEVTSNSDVMVYLFNYGTTDLYFDAVQLKRPWGVKLLGRNIQVDGARFFPYAVYGGTPREVAELGFNCFQPYAVANDFILEESKQYNVKVLYELSGLIRVGGLPNPDKLPNHPSILGWYFDEPDHPKYPTSPTQLRYITELLKKTNKPTIGCVMSWAESNPYQYGTSVDMIGANIYPFEYGGIGTYEKNIKNLIGAAKGPAIVVTESNKKATPAQQGFLLYAPIVLGANGVFVWEWNAITEDFKKYSKEIGKLTDLLGGVHINVPGNYPACIKVLNNEYLYLMVNPSDLPINISVNTGYKYAIGLDGKTINKIEEVVEPWGRRVYWLKY